MNRKDKPTDIRSIHPRDLIEQDLRNTKITSSRKGVLNVICQLTASKVTQRAESALSLRVYTIGQRDH